MNGNRQMEVHYINTGFPYTVTESFMDLFEGLAYAKADTACSEALLDQDNAYWSMLHSSSYKYEFSGPASNTHYNIGHGYEINDFIPRSDVGRRVWEIPAPLSSIDSLQFAVSGSSVADTSALTDSEECLQANQMPTGPQVIWQDDIDPDHMTYEELLDLGEAVGTQNRGLSRERISSLPVTKCKFNFFSRKRSKHERCVICQMNYKRGDRQMSLPCKHVYHARCVTRWLTINKACPICLVEVPNEEPRRQ